MAKPIAVRVAADDCEVTVAGTIYRPHEGEGVWLIPGQSVGDVAVLAKFQRLQPEVEALKGEPDERLRSTQLYDEALQELCTFLARRIIDWDWTDLAGRPLPKPDGTAGPLQALETQELYWLLGAAKGETPDARKNELKPSPITSSATEPPPSPMSTGRGRSRTKAS